MAYSRPTPTALPAPAPTTKTRAKATTMLNPASASGGVSNVPSSIDLQFAGPILALATFLTIWWGHVLVRITHYYLGTKPAPAIFLGGLLLLLASTQTDTDLLAATL